MAKFVHLHNHSHYSLLDGLGKIDDIIARTKELGMDAIAITDHGALYGSVEFYKKAKKAGIKPILGVETYVAPTDHTVKQSNGGERYYHLILLAKNETGWKNLIKLVTVAHLEGFYYKPRIDKDLLRKHHEGLIALSACITGEVSKAILNHQMIEAESLAREYESIFGKGNYYLEIGHHPGIPETITANEGLIELSKKTGIPLVATHDTHYVKPEDAQYHDILLAVQTGNTIYDKNRLTLKEDDFSIRSPEEMEAFFKDVPEALENTVKIAEQCNVEIELGKTQLPKFDVPEGKTAADMLHDMVIEKAPRRYAEVTPAIRERIEYELGVINKTGFADYFLIVQDFVNWAKDHGIAVGPGRGSAAGSIISYILNITDLDPIHYDLLFERFLNPDRIQMPDIDIDFADKRRDEVFGYLEEKYGKDRVAHIITFGTMAARAAIRDAGRALGLTYGFCDQVAKMIPFNADLETALGTVAELKTLYDTNPDARRVIDAAKNLEGVARHASVHACGTVIAPKPLTEYMPIQYAPQDEDTIITQFEGHSVEDLGLLKMDLLGLKNLTIIEDTLRLLDELHGTKVDIGTIPLDDAKTFELLKAADTTGVFQLESSGMRRYLKELKPHEMEDIIAMVALYRPGPMELIPQYINRKFGRERITYLHPKLEPILKKTYGVAIYQEQLMQIARTLAGFTLGEADTLRKAVGKKIKALMDEQSQKMIDGMVKNGITQRTAEQIWHWFEPFARYGFNRSHAACYAMIAYRTAYLRAHYPVELYSSLFNADAHDTDRIAILIGEAKKAGIAVLAPDINKSMSSFVPEGPAVRFGLLAIKNVGQNIVNAIVDERRKGGPFKSLVDLLQRVDHKDLNKKTLENLLKSGALDSLDIERNMGLSNLEDIVKFASTVRKSKLSAQASLFGLGTPSTATLKLKQAPAATPTERLAWEKELLGLYVSDHPLNQYKDMIAKTGAQQIKNLLVKTDADFYPKTKIVGLVSQLKRITTKLGQPMMFARVEDLSDAIEVIVFSDTLEKTNLVWGENKILQVNGKMSWRGGEPKFICDNVREI
ncbi:DNA polymerase III subunit alpha [Patescibacteria group bacterium]|nr:DNA polymerase III subunit alpha [Patescibacteria group bacterium]